MIDFKCTEYVRGDKNVIKIQTDKIAIEIKERNGIKQEKGITLITLVITIIVLLILSAISISTIISNTGILKQAEKAEFLNEYTTYKEVMELIEGEDNLEQYVDENKTLETSLTYNIIHGSRLEEYLSNVEKEIMDRIIKIDGEIIYITDEFNENTKNLESIGYKIVASEDIEYVIELKIIENLIELSNLYGYSEIGKQVETIAYPDTVYIAGISFGDGWNVLGDGDENGSNTNILKEIEEIGKFTLTEEEKAYLKNSPYIVNYIENDYVLSINGKETRDEEVEYNYTYSYNYPIPIGYISNNIYAAVTEKSDKTEENYGAFLEVNKEKELTYVQDKYGNEGLVSEGNPVAMPLNDSEVNINEQYTLSILVQGTTNQKTSSGTGSTVFYPDGKNYYGATIIAISSGMEKYTAWISMAEGYLRVYVYSSINISKGFTYVDISEFDNKFMHIMITAQKGTDAKLYINGTLKSTFEIENNTFNNTEITLGDLRPGRGLFYNGNIYDVIIYDRVLTENEIEYTWNYVKKQYHIDETGTQY